MSPERILLDEALQRGPGGAREQPREADGTFRNRAISTVTDTAQSVVTSAESVRQGGNAVSYAVSRLSRERPDLLAKVKTDSTTTGDWLRLITVIRCATANRSQMTVIRLQSRICFTEEDATVSRSQSRLT